MFHLTRHSAGGESQSRVRSRSTVTAVLASRIVLQSDSTFLEIESFERSAKSFDEFLRGLTPQAQYESWDSSLAFGGVAAMFDCIKSTLAKRLQKK
jgi:hypothetical protein